MPTSTRQILNSFLQKSKELELLVSAAECIQQASPAVREKYGLMLLPLLRKAAIPEGDALVPLRVRVLRSLAVLDNPVAAGQMLKTYALSDPSPWVNDVCLLLLEDLKHRYPMEPIRIPPRWQRVFALIRRIPLIKPFLILLGALVAFLAISWLTSRFDPRIFSVPMSMFIFNCYYVVVLYFALMLHYERQTWRAWRGLGVAGLKVGMCLASAAAIGMCGIAFLGPLPFLMVTAAIAASVWIARRFIMVPAFRGGVVHKTLRQFLAPSVFALIYVAIGMIPFQEITIQPGFLAPCTLVVIVSFYLFIGLNRLGISRIVAAPGEEKRLLVVARQTIQSRIGLFDAVCNDFRRWAIRAMGRLQHSPEIDSALYRILWTDPSGHVQAEAIKAREAIRRRAGKNPQEGLELVTVRGPGQYPFYKNVNGLLFGVLLTLAALISTGRVLWNVTNGSPEAAKAFFLYRIGDEKAAVQTYEKYLQTAERNPEILNMVAWIYSTARDPAARNPDRAIEYALAAIELDGGKKGHYIDTLAEAYIVAGRTKEARETFERALKSSSVTHGLYVRYRMAQIEQISR